MFVVVCEERERERLTDVGWGGDICNYRQRGRGGDRGIVVKAFALSRRADNGPEVLPKHGLTKLNITGRLVDTYIKPWALSL